MHKISIPATGSHSPHWGKYWVCCNAVPPGWQVMRTQPTIFELTRACCDLTAPLARFPECKNALCSRFDHQRQAWYADSVLCFRYYTGGPAWSPLFFVPYLPLKLLCSGFAATQKLQREASQRHGPPAYAGQGIALPFPSCSG